MKRVSYAGDSFLTADTAADALVDLAAVVGEARRAEVVELPAVDTRGNIRPVRLVVGPATQLSAISEESPFREPDSEALVSHLKARARDISPRYVAVATPLSSSTIDLDDIDSA